MPTIPASELVGEGRHYQPMKNLLITLLIVLLTRVGYSDDSAAIQKLAKTAFEALKANDQKTFVLCWAPPDLIIQELLKLPEDGEIRRGKSVKFLREDFERVQDQVVLCFEQTQRYFKEQGILTEQIELVKVDVANVKVKDGLKTCTRVVLHFSSGDDNYRLYLDDAFYLNEKWMLIDNPDTKPTKLRKK